MEAVEDESDEDDEEADAMLVMNDEGVELEAAAPEIPSDDESVEVDVAPVKPRSVSSDLVALRQNARKASTKAREQVRAPEKARGVQCRQGLHGCL